MKFYNREKTETVTANAGKLVVLLALFKDKVIQDSERALRVAGAPLFRAFHSFSNAEIEAAIEEAEKAGSDTAVLEAFKEDAPGPEAPALEAVSPGPAPVPETPLPETPAAPSEEAPSPEAVPNEPTTESTN